MVKRWKRHELAVAKALGTTRNPSNGRRQSDIDAGPFAIEHKTKMALPLWFTKMMVQAVAGVKGDQTPLAIIDYCKGRGHTTERYVIMRWQDWLEWHDQTTTRDGA